MADARLPHVWPPPVPQGHFPDGRDPIQRAPPLGPWPSTLFGHDLDLCLTRVRTMKHGQLEALLRPPIEIYSAGRRRLRPDRAGAPRGR